MKRIQTLILLLSLAGLVWFSLHLALTRIYQVDECTEVYVSKILSLKDTGSFTGHVTLFQVLLSPLIRSFNTSTDLFAAARFVMLELFWLNLVLIAVATGEKLFSIRGLIALLGAATLAPLWDFGFEIRHDNLLLTGLLLMWCAVRLRPAGMQSYFIVGALAAGLQFVAFKAFVYTVPISVAILLFPPANHKAPRWKLVMAWVTAALGTFLVIRIMLGAMGLWELFLATNQSLSEASSDGHRFYAWKTLGRLLGQTPLLLALLISALAAVVMDLRRRRKAALNWNGILPEATFFMIAMGALLINPAPFPYNLLFLVPFIFLFVFRHALVLVKESAGSATLRTVFIAVLVFAHLVPFGQSTVRHLKWTNFRQTRLMGVAENLTDPARDAIFDGVNMVAARPTDPRWAMHSFKIQSYYKGPEPRMRELLAEKPPAVIFPNYRTDWLPQADHAFFRERYVSLSDDFLVLGKVLPHGGGTFEIYHPGRYRIATLEGSDLAGTYPSGVEGLLQPSIEGAVAGTLDGVSLTNLPVELAVGSHQIKCASDCQPTVVWVGPRLNRVGRQGDGNHRSLFNDKY